MRHTMATLCVLLAACAAPQYEAASWTKMSQEQAEAECMVVIHQPGDVPFSFCMAARGWAQK